MKGKERLRAFATPMGVFAFSLLLYLPSLDAPFTYDDVLVSLENPMLGSSANLTRYFSSELSLLVPEELSSYRGQRSSSGLYRPLLLISYHLDHLLFGLHALGWRVINAVLHASTALLVFFVLLRLLASRRAALVGASAFAAHPAHAEAVLSLLGGRAEMLAGLFVLLGWLAFLHPLDDERRWPRIGWRLLAAAFLLLGLFSKESAVVLPGLVFLGDWGLKGKAAKNTLLAMVPQLAVLAGYVALRLMVVGRLEAQDWSHAFGDLPGWRIALSAMAIMLRYLFMAMFPIGATHPDCFIDLPGRLGMSELLGSSLLLPGIIVLSAVVLVRARQAGRSAFIATGVLMFFACLLPVSHVVPFAVVMAQRFLFIPSVPFSLVLAHCCLRYCRSRQLAILAPVAILAFFSTVTVLFLLKAKDPEQIYRQLMECRPRSVTAHNNLGTFLLRQGRIDEAMAQFNSAIGIDPDDPDPLYNKGLCLQKFGLAAEAEDVYREVLRISPAHPMAPNNLGVLLSARGLHEEAASFFELAIRNDPAHPEPVVNLAILREQQGDFNEAERLYRLAVKMDPRLEIAREALSRIEKLSRPPP